MRFLKVLLALVATIALLHCGVVDGPGEPEPNPSSTASALCAAEWSPTWRQGSGTNEWWIEYEIGGGTVASAYLEIPGVHDVTLSPHYGKWAASAGLRIASGTNVVVHATTTSGQAAQTVIFRYLTDTTPTSDSCTSRADAGVTDAGTSTGGCFAPTFTLGGGANDWWVEFAISGTIASAYLQVVNGQRVDLSFGVGKWRGSPAARVASGTRVFLHAVNASGQVAESAIFRYLGEISVAKPCSGGGADGGDGGTGGRRIDPCTCSFVVPGVRRERVVDRIRDLGRDTGSELRGLQCRARRALVRVR